MNEVVRKEMYREQCICLGIINNRNNINPSYSNHVIDLRDFYNQLGDKADKLINLHNRVECKAATEEAFKIYKLMNRINSIFKHQSKKNIWK